MLLFATYSPAADGVDDKDKRLLQLRTDIKNLRQNLQGNYGKKDSLTLDLRRVELTIAQHSRQLKKRSRQLEKHRGELRQLKQDLQDQALRLGVQQQVLARQMRASYAMGRQGTIKILLSAQDPAAIGRTLTYYNYFNQARAKRINFIAIEIIKLEQLQQDIGAETRQLQLLLTRQEKQQLQRELVYQRRFQVLIKLKGEIGVKEKRLQQLVQDKKRLAKLMLELQKALSDIPPDVGNLRPFSTLRGTLQFPAQGRVSARFGSTRYSGNLRRQGIIITARVGKEVQAVYHGRVAFADWLRNFGMLIILDHGDGYMSLYAHNQALYKEVGEWVNQGDLIATVGSSGGQANPGLYFEIRHNGKPADPEQWLKSARKRK